MWNLLSSKVYEIVAEAVYMEPNRDYNHTRISKALEIPTGQDGTFMPKAQPKPMSTDSSTGLYQSESGKGLCEPCEKGNFSESGASSCTSCSHGEFSPKSASSCSGCIIGQYGKAKAL